MTKQSIAFLLALTIAFSCQSGANSSDLPFNLSVRKLDYRFSEEALAPSLVSGRFSRIWPKIVWQIRQRLWHLKPGTISVIALSADGSRPFRLRIDHETKQLFDIADSCGLSIKIAGSMARRMAWGQKPFNPQSDLDIVVDFPEDRDLREEIFAKVGLFQRKVKEFYPDLYVDLVNDPYRPRSAVRHVTVNLLRVERNRMQFQIGDSAGGAYLADARSPILRFEPGQNIPLRLADLFKLLKIQEDAADLHLQIDRTSWDHVRMALASGLLLSSDPKSLLQNSLFAFAQNDMVGAAQFVPLLGNFLSILMRSRHPTRLIDQLSQLVTPCGTLVSVFDQVIDVTKAAARVRNFRHGGWPLAFRDFDDLYRSSIAAHPVASAFSISFLSDYLASAIAAQIGRPLDHQEKAWLRHFYDEELVPWVKKNALEPAPFRVVAGRRILGLLVNAMLSPQPQEAPILQLASITSKEFAGHLQRSVEAIRSAIHAGQYRHLLEYYA